LIFKKSCASFGIKDYKDLVKELNASIKTNSEFIIGDAERQLIDDTPEAYVQREIGLEKERKKRTNKLP
jgi:hypothetical protein